MRLTTIGQTKPGDVIYLRPDHKKYEYGCFAIVGTNRVNGQTGVVHLREQDTKDQYIMTAMSDPDRAVEVVATDLAAKVCGVHRDELRSAARCMRDESATIDDACELVRRMYMERIEIVSESIADARPAWARVNEVTGDVMPSNDGHG